jgi:hypothetical protein
MESIMLLNNTPFEKQYQNYLIKLSSDLDIINILIEKDITIYESNFNLEELHQYQLLRSFTTQEIIEFIRLLDIEIKEENMNLKLILISSLPNISNVELNLQKKNIISNEMIEKLFKEFENLKKENKELKDSIGKLNKRIEKLEKNNKIKEIENRIEKLEGFHYIDNKHKIQLKSCNLKNLSCIKTLFCNWIKSYWII